MKISKTKYFGVISKIHADSLPPALREAHQEVMSMTEYGEDWSAYGKDQELTALINLVYTKAEELIKSNYTHLTPKDIAMRLIQVPVRNGEDMDYFHNHRRSIKEEDFEAHTDGGQVIVTMLYGTKICESFSIQDLIHEVRASFVSPDTKKRLAKKKRAVYQHTQPQFRILKAILTWDNKDVYRSMVTSFVTQIKKYRKDKTLTSSSPVFKEIKLVQEKLEAVLAAMTDKATIRLSPETKALLRKALKKVTAPQAGKEDQQELSGIATTLLTELPVLPVPIKKAEAEPAIMSSEDFAKTQFQTIGLKDKWFNLIGDPSAGFKTMVFGMPKMGKSYLCVDFASYLSKNHGKVLYISKEEFLSPTLALKIKDKNAANANLDIAGSVPPDLSPYQFVFLDSVTSLKLKPDDLKMLEQKYPTISFVYVFQVTKAGSARGTNEYMHNVDVVIEIPENGKAVQFGRYNQGGKMDIFPGAAPLAA